MHGAVRGTIDIDIVLHWILRDLEAAETALRSIGRTLALEQPPGHPPQVENHAELVKGAKPYDMLSR